MPKFCSDVISGAVQVSQCPDGTYCGRTENDMNIACCESRLGGFVKLSGVPITFCSVEANPNPGQQGAKIRTNKGTCSWNSTMVSPTTSNQTLSTSSSQASSLKPSTSSSQVSNWTSSISCPKPSRSAFAPSLSKTLSAMRSTTGPDTTNTAFVSGGYDTDNKIGLGVGLGIGLPTLIISLLGFVIMYLQFRKRAAVVPQSSHRMNCSSTSWTSLRALQPGSPSSPVVAFRYTGNFGSVELV